MFTNFLVRMLQRKNVELTNFPTDKVGNPLYRKLTNPISVLMYRKYDFISNCFAHENMTKNTLAK